MFFEPVDSDLNSESSSFKRNEVEETIPMDGKPDDEVKVQPMEVGSASDDAVQASKDLVDESQSEINHTVRISEEGVELVDTGKAVDPILDTDGAPGASTPTIDSPTDDGRASLEEKYMKAVADLSGASEIVAPEVDATPVVAEENTFEKYMTKATDAKTAATEAFKMKDYNTAKLNYMTALETLQVRFLEYK